MQQAEAFVTISTLQEERVELLALKDALQKYIRQLEQNNDDLERGKRSALSLSLPLSLSLSLSSLSPSLSMAHYTLKGPYSSVYHSVACRSTPITAKSTVLCVFRSHQSVHNVYRTNCA